MRHLSTGRLRGSGARTAARIKAVSTRCTGMAATVAVSASLAVAVSAPASADTRVFEIWNITAGPVVLYGYDATQGGTAQPANVPAPGTTIQVGQSQKFTLTNRQAANPRFNGQGQKQDWRVAMFTSDSGVPDIKCSQVPGTPAACSAPIGNNVIALWDAPNTSFDVPAAQAQKQAGVFNSLCLGPYQTALQIKCDYTGMQKSLASTPWHLPQDFTPQTNRQEVASSKTWTVSSTTSQTTSFTLTAEASAKFYNIVNTSIKAQWQDTHTESHTFTETDKLKIPPGHTGYICLSNPLNRFTGTLKVTAGNTTWNLQGVVVDTPKPESPGRIETWDTEKYIPGDPCEGFVRDNAAGATRGS